MNKVVDNLLKNVEEFEIFFNEYEKQFYPEIRKARKNVIVIPLSADCLYVLET